MQISNVLDYINSIAVFQLIFFTLYLFHKGNKIPSVYFLKIHLISQLISFISYLYFSTHNAVLRPFLLISFPAMFLWGPTFYFYLSSRLYKMDKPVRNLLLHGIPSIIVFVLVLWILIWSEDPHYGVSYLGRLLFIFLKVQLLIYPLASIYRIYRYRKNIGFITSANEDRKLNWLLLFTYGILITSAGDLALNMIPGYRFSGLGYILFWLFINIFFFKAIVQPDQFLCLDESKFRPVKLAPEKSKTHYKYIEEVVDKNKLYLDPELKLKQVAKAVNLTDRTVSQTIRLNSNMNFTEYINHKRIEHAKVMLETTTSSEKNILEILYDSGFNSKSVFNTQFKKSTGKSPKDYRKSFFPEAESS